MDDHVTCFMIVLMITPWHGNNFCIHYIDVIMSTMASQITSLTIVYSTVYSGADQRRKSKLRVTGLGAGNSPLTGEFPAQMASNAKNVSIWWRHHVTGHLWGNLTGPHQTPLTIMHKAFPFHDAITLSETTIRWTITYTILNMSIYSPAYLQTL